jgi:hypothetical protein
MGRYDKRIAELVEQNRLDTELMKEYEAGLNSDFENGVNVTEEMVEALKSYKGAREMLIEAYRKGNGVGL